METDAITSLMERVAAEVVTPRFRALAAGDVHEKNPGDLVTVADREAEHLLEEALAAAYPQAVIVGEEATARRPDLPTALAHAEQAFVVDPVDGTKNFVNGSADHAVMVAELRSGRTVRAWIVQPAYGRSYAAELGAGVTCNGRPLPAAPPRGDGDLVVMSARPSLEGMRDGVMVRPSRWSCGIDYPLLLEGAADAAVYVRTMAWDHAPGSLMITEAGGVVGRPDGSPYRPADVERLGLIVAGSTSAWDAAEALLGESLRQARLGND